MGYKGNIDELQAIRMDELLRERLQNIITTAHFQKALNLPKSHFGVGLGLHTSQTLAEKLDLALEKPIPETTQT
jgi:hypothetical protein